MPTAAFAEGNEDTPTQALTSVDITFPKPEEGKKIGDGSAAFASDLTFLDFGRALWQQDGEPKKLKADDTYEKDNIYLLYFAFYTQKPITNETALTFNGNPITRYADHQALTEALNAYDGKEDAYLGSVMFSKDGTGDPSMGDLKNIYVVGLYAIIRAQEHTVEEQFNLDSGGTYYFDLFGENIPGTANSDLPDNTLHYVPFTYAGTADAYKLTSTMEATDEYAQQNKYPHSLFIADYAVTNETSWDELNAAGLIFGKGYASGGIDYTMRVPSEGSASKGSGDSERGNPQSNEWDMIMNKDEGYVKNWSRMFSWGQDNAKYAPSLRAVRGSNSARYWTNYSSAINNYTILGFRPILEVLNPDTLGADGLKVVTLDLGGGKLGNSSEDIQIIVKNGSAFTAPTSDGLTRPDGNNGSSFKWLGSDGNLYAPGKSVPANVTKLTAQFAPPEQFNLVPGGTYYFDLSGASIPGTVNTGNIFGATSLPDTTLHYVPFTYAGTVDAYKLTSEKETTEKYAQQNKYPHSLFIANHNVTHTISWNDLNTADLIFGKDYAAGGVNYTLRAPSAGSGRTGSDESQHGTPQINEWDKMLDKNDGYIKNWKRMASWGQDTRPDNSTPFRAVRGFHSARFWGCSSSSDRDVTLGFRPVLEVLNPDTLGSGGLKAVTLALGGGTLGGSAEDIQIIVKNGESFTAPASDGLTRPDGNTENYFKWLGSDGNLYAPSESVSADVTKLTAKFAGGSSGSGGGGGSRKPSVTYYTLHFETNGGSTITDMREENNTRISLTKYVPTRHGYTFIGWYSDRSLTNQVSEVSLTKNMTVYAGWRADENPDIVVNPFTDVSEKDWFYNDAMFVYKNGLMLGTSKTLFSPHGTVTRGMMATILWRMEGSLAPKGENSFTDVEAGRWYADAITWAAENGIFAGYSMDKFGPDDPITREQLTAIFYRYADYKGYKLTVTGNLDKFEDADKITDYANTVMQWAVGNGLIKGKAETLLDPQGTATRAEIAAMLHRFVENTKPMQAD
ncbi:S-layer homology domain-containing protein [Anaerotignum faecicola]|nr:S-layer homology domain-containing protein [Anaerotignum faecicola]